MPPGPSLVPASCLCFLPGPPCLSTQFTRPQSSSVSPAGSLRRALYAEVTDVALKWNFLRVEGTGCKPGPPGAQTVSSLLPYAAWGRAWLRACHESRVQSGPRRQREAWAVCALLIQGTEGPVPREGGGSEEDSLVPRPLMPTLRTLAAAAQGTWSITIPHLGRGWPEP